MKTVLRVALAFAWLIVPLQSWLVVLGGIVLVFGLAFGAFATHPNNLAVYAVVAMVGAVFVALVPAMAGGAALRSASSPTMLHLRPHGRARLLAATVLTITALAALIALPMLLAQLASHLHGFAARSEGFRPGFVFMVSWTVIASMWLTVFLTSGSRLLSFFIAFMPMVFVPPFLIRSAKAGIEMPSASTWFTLVLGAWLLFTIWYMQARSFRTPRWFGDRSSQTFENSPAGMMASLLEFSRGAVSTQRASSQLLLGVSSPFSYAFMTTAWVAVFFAGFAFLSPGRARVPGYEFVLLFGCISGAQLAYMCTRRARMLWLRTGTDRASLFTMAENHGLAGTLWSLVLMTVVLGAFTLVRAPERVGPLLMLAAVQIPAWIGLFYSGMALTRGVAVTDVILYVVIGVLIIVEMAALGPGGNPSPQVLATIAGVSLVACALFRKLAKHRWMSLDWRVARLPAMGQRAN
jgi:hypothetical protein